VVKAHVLSFRPTAGSGGIETVGTFFLFGGFDPSTRETSKAGFCFAQENKMSGVFSTDRRERRYRID
jgi:hypothetical protein